MPPKKRLPPPPKPLSQSSSTRTFTSLPSTSMPQTSVPQTGFFSTMLQGVGLGAGSELGHRAVGAVLGSGNTATETMSNPHDKEKQCDKILDSLILACTQVNSSTAYSQCESLTNLYESTCQESYKNPSSVKKLYSES